MNTLLAICLMILLFLSIMYFVYQFYLGLKQNNVLQRAVDESNRVLSSGLKASKERIFNEEELRLQNGEQEKTNFLYRIDLLIEESNIKKYFKFMNTELYIVLVIVFSVTGLIISSLLSHNLIISFLILTVIIVGMTLLLLVMGLTNRVKVERNIITFVNLLGSYNQVSDDIITIFDNLQYEIEEPLRTNIKACVDEARDKGNVTLALSHLRFRVNNEIFQDIIRNTEVVSRYNADYSAISKHSRKVLKDYLKAKENLKRIARNFKADVLIMCSVAVGVFVFVTNAMDIDIYTYLFNTTIGNIFLILIALITFSLTYLIIAIDYKSK